MNKQLLFKKSIYFVLSLLFLVGCNSADDTTLAVHTVSFDTDGGNKIENQEVFHGEKVTQPTQPEKVGHEFLSWTLNEEDYDFEQAVESDITLKATWEELEVTYKATFQFDNGAEDSVVTVLEDGTLEEPKHPIKEGYLFQFWSVDGAAFDFKTPITSDITLVAVYEEVINQFVVTFDADNGDQLVQVTVDENELVAEPTDTPIKEGYEFLGWYVGDTAFDFNTPITADITIVAKWELGAGETTVDYATMSQADFQAMNNGDHATVKAQLNRLGRGWAWGTEVFLIDEEGNSTKDLYSSSNYGCFTFPLVFAAGDPEFDGRTFVFDLVKDIYMSSPQVGFAYERNEQVNGQPAYNGLKWLAPMRYGIEYFDEVVRGNVIKVSFDGTVKAKVGTEEISFKILNDEGGYDNLSEDQLSLVEGFVGENKYVRTITVNGEIISVLHDGQPQISDSI
ncbi:InlB B-repeat-containing protein [Flammeovirga sp. MY04]|uniref:InlB B-repeat-containing protein n=1 Tax=Flammeovirga sp. MY04 TaxID=1191459 RepID=UPI0008061BC8|nr:InlB B-repeat-containing protein [Flammeovirga sp. MY04]ANQ52783.1 InlB B-repeat-containing protein [Flammeovirga sp. MY04]